MSKFSNLLKFSLALSLVLGFFATACSHQITQMDGESNILTEREAPVEESKDSNSVRVNSDSNSISKKKGVRTQKKPLFDWPVWEARMTRGFLPHGTKRRKRPHKGIDLAAPRGSAVMAAHDGIIIYTGSGFKGYGKMVMIESNSSEGSGFATLYGHLDKIVVFEGKRVSQGEVIGALGNTGRSSGPHLHFEIRKLNGPIDPLPLLPAGDALTNDVDNGAIEE